MATTADPVMRADDLIWQWLDSVVIAENFCPFAKPVRIKNQIRLSCISEFSDKTFLTSLEEESRLLLIDANDSNCSNIVKPETTLIAVLNGLSHFEDYLDVLSIAEMHLEMMGYSGKVQIASFHPEYVFEGEDPNAASHFTNRAPFPIFHLIKEESITRALKTFKEPESIPQRNMQRAEQLGKAFFSQFLLKN